MQRFENPKNILATLGGVTILHPRAAANLTYRRCGGAAGGCGALLTTENGDLIFTPGCGYQATPDSCR
jgi:hypothetical protein